LFKKSGYLYYLSTLGLGIGERVKYSMKVTVEEADTPESVKLACAKIVANLLKAQASYETT
jgi:hypothetical protein